MRYHLFRDIWTWILAQTGARHARVYFNLVIKHVPTINVFAILTPNLRMNLPLQSLNSFPIHNCASSHLEIHHVLINYFYLNYVF